jgi:hypothetical protein
MAKSALHRSDQSLDGETLSRLRRARAAAMQQQDKSGRVWLPLGSAVTAALVIALVWPHTEIQAPATEVLALEQWLLEADAELEMIEEVDFYQWLAEEELSAHSS